MPDEMYHALAPLIIALFIFWLLYRIKMRMTNVINRKIAEEFPYIKNQLNNFQQKIEYLNSRLDLLERKVNALGDKTKSQ